MVGHTGIPWAGSFGDDPVVFWYYDYRRGQAAGPDDERVSLKKEEEEEEEREEEEEGVQTFRETVSQYPSPPGSCNQPVPSPPGCLPWYTYALGPRASTHSYWRDL